MACEKLTDPFTGAEFVADIECNGKSLFINYVNAINGARQTATIVDGCMIIPFCEFNHIELMKSCDVCMELHISRQRLSQLVASERLRCILIGDSQYFIVDDVLEYKNRRKVGRPAKED